MERWITPELFEGLEARDETEFCKELGGQAAVKLQDHRRTYITSEDFRWISEHGLNSVRIPVPYLIFGELEPYVGCVEFLDFALQSAAENKLKIIIDLHTAPGSQNGYDHSGLTGQLEWHKDNSNVDKMLEVIEKIAERYKDSSSFAGIELLNEPSPKIPHQLLLDFYKHGYELVRRHCSDSVAVIVSDAYRPHDWSAAFDGDFNNIVLDVHLYQAFSWLDKRKNIHKILGTVTTDWKNLITEIQRSLPVVIGEWSLGLDKRAFKGMGDFERDKAMQAYARAQQEIFSLSRGNFFWTYKTSNMAGWSFRDALKFGWIKTN